MTDNKFRVIKVFCACLIGLVFFMPLPASGQQSYTCSPTESSAKRLTVFISDLHMGVGKLPGAEKWNAMEDFLWGEEFHLFLEEIHRIGGGKTDLVINGDFFELWQFVKDNCDYGNPDLGCTEKDALERVQIVLKEHEPEMQMLKKFADSPGENRVYIVPGNHDAAFLYSGVAQEAIKKINATPGRVCILPNGYWRSSDGLIYADHGHQIEDADPNSYKGEWPEPFIKTAEGNRHLIRVWGERFVQKYYNPIEEEFPIIDNLSEEKLGFKYGVAARGGYLLSTPDIAKLTKFVFLEVSKDQFTAFLHGLYLKPDEKTEPAKWNIEEIKRSNDKSFVSDLSTVLGKLTLDSSIDKIALDRVSAEGKLELRPTDLSDDEIIAICNLWAVLLEEMKGKEQVVSIQNCPTTEPEKLGIQKLIWDKDAVFRKHLQAYLEKRAKELPSIQGYKPLFNVYIYGHTHAPHDGNKHTGIKIADYPWPPQVFNTGTWIRVIDEEGLNELVRYLNLKDREVLPRIQVEQLSPSYSFVMIKPYEKRPIAELRYWVLDSKGKWRLLGPPKWVLDSNGTWKNTRETNQ